MFECRFARFFQRFSRPSSCPRPSLPLPSPLFSPTSILLSLPVGLPLQTNRFLDGARLQWTQSLSPSFLIRRHRIVLPATNFSLSSSSHMSPVAIIEMAPSTFSALFESLRTAPTAPGMHFRVSDPLSSHHDWRTDAKAAADKLAREVSKQGLQSVS